MDLNLLAKKIACLEGKKVPVNIAQIKEIIGCMGKIFRSLDPVELADVINSITSKAGYSAKSKKKK